MIRHALPGHRWSARLAAVVTVGTVMTVTTATGCAPDSPERSDTAYCTAVGANLAALNSTGFADAVEVEAVLTAWRDVAATAPLAIEPEWQVVMAAMERAAQVAPGDGVALQEAADALRQAQPAADRVIDYTYRLCNALIGPTPPVTTTPLQVPPTTDDASSTSSTATP